MASSFSASSVSGPAAVTAEGLSIGYKGVVLSSGIDVRLEPGQVTALLGRNGTGKSTLIRTLTGTLPPLAGRVLVGDKPLDALGRLERARRMALVTTGSGMAGGLRAFELVSLGRHPHTGYFGRLSAADRGVVEEAMRAVEVYGKRDAFVSELSDGERQKVMIARALAQQAPVIIMDEPFSFLDVAARIEILALLKEIAAARQAAVLFSTHDVSQAMRMADYAWMFYPDRRLVADTPSGLISSGAIDGLFDNPRVRFSRSQCDFILG